MTEVDTVVDTVVIGAGVLGLAVARALALAGQEVIVIEKERSIGQGISSRNSEVIHAGLYYPSGSLKARLCVQGRQMLYAYCQERSIPHANCGKLIVATSSEQLPQLQALQAQAGKNGVPVQWFDRAQALAMEPQLECVAALHSPSTGIVDSHALMLSLQGDLERAGGVVALATEVMNVEFTQPKSHEKRPIAGRLSARSATKSIVSELASPAESVELTHIGFRQLVNAAGLFAVQLMHSFTGLPTTGVAQTLTPYFAKGHYFSLSCKAPFSRLVYPLPESAGLGVHLTLDLAGQARFGPDVQWLHGLQDAAQIDYSVDAARAQDFYTQIRRYWPGLQEGQLAPSYSGVRPKISDPDQNPADFLIQGPDQHGQPGLVNLLGMESPGLTSCLAVAQEVVDLLSNEFAIK